MNSSSGPAELLARVEAATGPDRELDCLLWAWDRGLPAEWQGKCLVCGDEGVVGWIDPGEHQRNFYTNRPTTGPGHIPALSASLDATLALVERVLPAAHVSVNSIGAPWSRWEASVAPEFDDFGECDEEAVRRGEAPTPALALLSALIKALIADDGASLGGRGGSGNE